MNEGILDKIFGFENCDLGRKGFALGRVFKTAGGIGLSLLASVSMGFAIYDAPEPWGLWKTAYYTKQWDVCPGEHGDFPSKWIRADGRSARLVFSGDDAFSVRRVQFKIAKPESRTQN